VHDGSRGGGRLVGEGCHFIDLVTWLAQSPVKEVCANALTVRGCMSSENVSVLMRLENGSAGVVNYFSNGHGGYPKERVEVHSLGRTLVLDNFRKLTGYGFRDFKEQKLEPNKGHREQFDRLFEHISTGKGPIMRAEEIWNSSRAALAARDSLWMGGWVKVV